MLKINIEVIGHFTGIIIIKKIKIDMVVKKYLKERNIAYCKASFNANLKFARIGNL
ncbi:hypothetical protein NCCP28_13020 [Niallia sp. NCCP-28]|nr:hypothetical protein NCCP28_13020 [Niallia sp. NCCP-28]